MLCVRRASRPITAFLLLGGATALITPRLHRAAFAGRTRIAPISPVSPRNVAWRAGAPARAAPDAPGRVSPLASSYLESLERTSGSELYEPSWEELTQVPVSLTQPEWANLGKAKQLAVLCRLSVIHLTVISCAAPCLLASLRGGASAARSVLYVFTLVLWHLAHNVINDMQDLDVGLDKTSGAFRRSYGAHPIADGFVTRQAAEKVVYALMCGAAAGSSALALSAKACAWAFPAGLAATLLYTPLAKPRGLGEILVYLVWGPAMVGGGFAAAAGVSSRSATWLASMPLALGAFAMIFGKHIDKIDEPTCTLPKLLGRRAARVTAAAALVGQHVSTCLLVRAGLLPPAVLLTLLCLPFETLAATKILLADKATKPAPTEKPSYDVEYRGSMLPFVPAKAFPLWFVAVAGWHAVVYGYWFCFGLAGAVLRKAWL